MTEVNVAKMAQERASRQEVKDYAQRLERYDTNANQMLSSMASQLQVKMTEGLDARHQAMVNRLTNLTGLQLTSSSFSSRSSRTRMPSTSSSARPTRPITRR